MIDERVAQRLEDFGRGFMECFRRVNVAAAMLQCVRTLPPTVSTITFTGTLSTTKLPVDAMRVATELASALGSPFEFEVDCHMDKKKRRGAGGDAGKRFRYQLPLKRHGKSVKVFHNGSVHATGCTSPLEFLETMSELLPFIRDTAGVNARLVDFDIQLINALFVATCPRTGRPLTVAPGALLRMLPPEARADFDTERHPSVKIPLLEQVDGAAVKRATVCVFQTGSVSIMGAKRPEHVAQAFENTVELLDRAAGSGDVCVPDATHAMRTTTARRALTLQDGYPFNTASCCTW